MFRWTGMGRLGRLLLAALVLALVAGVAPLPAERVAASAQREVMLQGLRDILVSVDGIHQAVEDAIANGSLSSAELTAIVQKALDSISNNVTPAIGALGTNSDGLDASETDELIGLLGKLSDYMLAEVVALGDVGIQAAGGTTGMSLKPMLDSPDRNAKRAAMLSAFNAAVRGTSVAPLQ